MSENINNIMIPQESSRKPLAMRSADALPSAGDNLLARNHTNAQSLERIVGVYKNDVVPADSSSRRAGTESTRSTPPRLLNANGSMASSTENHLVLEQRPPLDQRPFPRNPRDTSTSTSPKRRSKVISAAGSIGSLRSARTSRSGTTLPQQHQQPDLWIHRSDPDAQEQALFEQRLCEDAYGVAVRKINQNGKSNLRYVKCVPLDDAAEDHTSTWSVSNRSISNKSVGSLVRSLSRKSQAPSDVASHTDVSHRNLICNSMNNRKRALTWGKKKDLKIGLERFTCVRKGKTTDRTVKNPSPACRLLSLITNDSNNPSLDIEAPTRLDRDKFARAFARFLNVPLETEGDFAENSLENKPPGVPKKDFSMTTGMDVPNTIMDDKKDQRMPPLKSPPVVLTAASASLGQQLELKVDRSPQEGGGTSLLMMASQSAVAASDDPAKRSANTSLNMPSQQTSQHAVTSEVSMDHKSHDIDEGTVVSSLTGAGFDQEIVEELHQALTELRAELESSRAEAARAVKVAEQAIQSAEKSNASDWNNTVTHKAAEAAAQAQKRSAEAIAKQRLAEERLAGERKSAEFWRKQAEAAEEEAGVMQTRAAAAEVRRASMCEELESERKKASVYSATLKQRFTQSESNQRELLEAAMERNRALEIELDGTRRDLESKHEEAKYLGDALADISSSDKHQSSRKKLGFIGRKNARNQADDKRDSTSLLSNEGSSSSNRMLDIKESGSGTLGAVNAESVLKLHAEASAVRQQFELLRRATVDELETLPDTAAHWADQASVELNASQAEIARLKEKLAFESAARRKLLHEVQDLRGTVRVYCRPRSSVGSNVAVSFPSQETVALHRDGLDSNRPLSFEFDRVFEPDVKQTEVYSEAEELVLSVLDGFNVCLMTYGQSNSGKTYTLLGEVNTTPGVDLPAIEITNHGIQLQAVQQLFTVAEHRNARYEDVFSLTIVEVYNERINDLVAGTKIGEERGQLVVEDTTSGGSKKGGSRSRSRANTEDDVSSFSHQGTSACSRSGRPTKLEIRTGHEGDIVVQGLVSIPVKSFDDVRKVWEQCLAHRSARLTEQGVSQATHDAASHVIATLKVMSTNIATGVATEGKIQFADLAAADLVQVPRKPPSSSKSKQTSADGMLAGVGNSSEWKFANKSLQALTDVVNAQVQYHQSVPYRNSTLTHLLRDSLQADTKVLMVVCVSSDPKDMQETACALKFASKMRRVQIGKATKHFVST